jgi:hypothetical protein
VPCFNAKSSCDGSHITSLLINWYLQTQAFPPSRSRIDVISTCRSSNIAQGTDFRICFITLIYFSEPFIMPKARNIDSSIQLQCTLCPKAPQFSDVSHLLTHISSKSHLSHRFKLQIRAQSESGAKHQLDNFDQWYHNNNLDVLLSSRLAAKEQKKSAKERKGAKFQASNNFVSNSKSNSTLTLSLRGLAENCSMIFIGNYFVYR